MKSFLNKYKILLLVILITITVGIVTYVIYINISNTKIKNINKDNYSFQYDNTWKITKQEQLEIKLLHKKSDSQLDIRITELKDEMQYKTLDEIFDNLLYNIQEQNKDYKLLYKENTKITKNNINGYKLLFEADETQVAIYFYKQGNKLIAFTYEATYSYFDILLDSVNSIIYNFSVNEQDFNVVTNIELETKDINYTEQKEIQEQLKETKDDEIVAENYLVNYSIPSNFKSTGYNTKSANYKFENLPIEGNLDLRTSIFNCNLYEYLDKEKTPNIYDSYKLNSYNKEKEAVNKFRDEPLSYIYKNSYLTNNKITENIEIVFELDRSHILRIVISSNGVGIPQELVNMIKINKIENIASNVKIEKENELLIGKLKRFLDYTYEKTEEITIKLKDTYKEIDKGQNLYEERHYGTNYNQEKQIYEYEVEYKTISFGIDDELKILDDSINKNNGKYSNFIPTKDIKINNKVFKTYERGYTAMSNATDNDGNRYKYYVNEKVLFYELQNNNYLIIIIKANDTKISDELINQFTNFDINVN